MTEDLMNLPKSENKNQQRLLCLQCSHTRVLQKSAGNKKICHPAIISIAFGEGYAGML